MLTIKLASLEVNYMLAIPRTVACSIHGRDERDINVVLDDVMDFFGGSVDGRISLKWIVNRI
jgi:hypothetical protein